MESKKKKHVSVMSFGEHVTPEYSEVTNVGRSWVSYGKDNKYPNYLLMLFESSPKHGAIIKGKAKYIFGKGFEFAEKQGDAMNNVLKIVNSHKESLNKVFKKCALDYEIHNGYYLQLIYGRGGGLTDVLHVDYLKVRSNEDNSMFYVRKSWTPEKGKVKEIPAFDPDVRKGSQIIFVKEYTPGVDTYTLPEYKPSQNYIESDILISEHVMNNAKSGFTGSKMITFTDGEPDDEEEARAIEKKLNDKFTGRKGSKLVVSFVNGQDNAPQVDDLGISDLSKEDFTAVDELVSQNIFTGHQVNSPMLFGVRVAGQLGGRSEIREAYEVFKNTYVNSRQQSHEEVFNTIMDLQGLPAIKISPVEPISFEFSENIITQYAPDAYILEKIGININDYAPEDLKNPKADAAAKAIADAAAATAQKFNDEEDEATLIQMFSEMGEKPASYFKFKSHKVTPSFTEAFIMAEGKAHRQAFVEITQLESNIIGLLKKDIRATPEVLAKALKVDPTLVKEVLSVMKDKGLITVKVEKLGDEKQITREVTDEGKVAVQEKKSLSTDILIKYSYDGPRDDRNRPLCAKLLALDKLYSRGEIEQVSQRLGYSVWERRGGFYHNPQTGKTTAFCRHYWTQHIVIKRK